MRRIKAGTMTERLRELLEGFGGWGYLGIWVYIWRVSIFFCRLWLWDVHSFVTQFWTGVQYATIIITAQSIHDLPTSYRPASWKIR
jgi:hypothetical protein